MSLRAGLVSILDEDRVRTRYLDRIARANDASVYRLVPLAVVQPRSIDEIRALFALSRDRRIPLTLRTAGTSLSGQAVTDGILVDVARYWREIRVEADGARVRVEPGVIGGQVNRHLERFGAKIGPDPASIGSCMMGGILANNSSGMCCGVEHNAYHTLEAMRFVLPGGRLVDTEETGANERLIDELPALARGLIDIKTRIGANAPLLRRIHSKYRMKNTNGYSLNAFVDHDRPLDILSHLMIGSEGTLGFIAQAVLRTIPDHPLKTTGLLFFPDVPRASTAIAALRESGARALELMDRASLRAVERQDGAVTLPPDLPDTAAAILVEYQCADEPELDRCRRAYERLLPQLPLIAPAELTRDPEHREALWRMRKGLIPSVGAMRRRGTSFILEDVVFPPERLAQGVGELQTLLAQFGYDDAIVFGHARDGNLHFVLTQSFEDPADVRRYDGFMQQLAQLVAVRHGGALKAEHGTGRNMAPFVATEWGDDALALMRELKALIDPDGLLNPGVILNDDPQAHVTHLKSFPTVEAEVDRCIECGFCERVCPSRDLTLTPRQRIVVRREMARLSVSDPQSPLLRELEADYRHAGLDTCATDGLCATACPVAIDTGLLVKRLRGESRPQLIHELAAIAADRFGLLERGAGLALRLARLAGTHSLPRPARSEPPASQPERPAALYFPACVSRVLAGPDEASASLPHTVLAVARRVGKPLQLAEDTAGHCCGLAFSSKGYREAHLRSLRRTVDALWRWSDRGRLPVVVDTSPCAYALKQSREDLSVEQRQRFDRLRILDSIEFARDAVLPALERRPSTGSAAVHPVCSVTRMQLTDGLRQIVAACALTPEVPLSSGCCGFAGDLGFRVPALTRAATSVQAAEIAAGDYRGYYSSSPTCELGMSRATGRPYRSFWYLLDQVTRERPNPA